MTNDVVAERIRAGLAEGRDMNNLAKKLTDDAINEFQSDDNVSVILVQLCEQIKQ